MDEASTSWIRRTKFSHTVYHRIDPSRLSSGPIRFQTREIPKFKPRSQATDLHKESDPDISQMQGKPLTNKHRSVSPLPTSLLPDTFKEARSETKRFSTPHRTWEVSDKIADESSVKLRPDSFPLRHLSPLEGFGKSKMRKDSSCLMLFDHGGGKVTALDAVDALTIDLTKLRISYKFASGANSRLYRAEYDGEPAAVKLMCVPNNDESGLLGSKLEKEFTREVAFLTRLHHPNVVKFIAAWKESPVYCIVTEYLSEGSLRLFLRKLDHATLPLEKSIRFALEIAHACDEIHCDPLAEGPGTYRWMAPEMIKHKRYGRKVDVYSFGLILWEMVSGSIPYEGMCPFAAAFAVVNKNLRPAFSKECPPAMRALIEQCWSLQPEKRPEFSQVVKVLELFESSLAHDGTLKLVQSSICLDHKKGFLHWIRKLSPPHSNSTSIPKPRDA
ncbi:serine/threonine/tyrosine-protein kinase HT1-like isoform X2 [Silene latifolia]|uniref:serine/threonine/tyrosine-protein kinase HT1-like isoform X2 n=1 Tax=Silene latifolia TaxID=37657 RepID=UPI003D787958